MSDDIAKKLGCSLSGPGPADYFLPSTVGHRNHDISKSRGPSFSMGVRLPGLFCDQRVKSESPGPKYQVEYLTKYGKSEVPFSTSGGSLRPKSCQFFGARRNRSLDRPQLSYRNPGQDFARKRSDTILNKTPDAKSYDIRKTAKTIERKNMNLNNDLRAFYMENQTRPKRQLISNARYGDACRRF